MNIIKKIIFMLPLALAAGCSGSAVETSEDVDRYVNLLRRVRSDIAEIKTDNEAMAVLNAYSGELAELSQSTDTLSDADRSRLTTELVDLFWLMERKDAELRNDTLAATAADSMEVVEHTRAQLSRCATLGQVIKSR